MSFLLSIEVTVGLNCWKLPACNCSPSGCVISTLTFLSDKRLHEKKKHNILRNTCSLQENCTLTLYTAAERSAIHVCSLCVGGKRPFCPVEQLNTCSAAAAAAQGPLTTAQLSGTDGRTDGRPVRGHSHTGSRCMTSKD